MKQLCKKRRPLEFEQAPHMVVYRRLWKNSSFFDRANTCIRPVECVDHLQQIGYWHESDSSIGREAAILSQFVLLAVEKCHS
jgi:hypothetical protein